MTKTCITCNGDESTGCVFTGKRNQCNACVHKRQHEWYMRKRESILVDRKRYASENKERISKYHKEWRVLNKDRKKEADKNYYLENRDTILERVKKYTLENLDIIKAYKVKYYDENKEYVKAKTKEYLKTPIGRSRAKALRYERRMIIKQSRDEEAVKWIAEQLVKSSFICVYCKNKFDISKHTIEHFVALKRGGGHTRDNIGLACIHCNSSKGAKDMKDWDIFRVKYKGHVIEGEPAYAV